MMEASEVQQWLSNLDPDDLVAIDEGGLTLIVVGRPDQYIEIGGEPDDDED